MWRELVYWVLGVRPVVGFADADRVWLDGCGVGSWLWWRDNVDGVWRLGVLVSPVFVWEGRELVLVSCVVSGRVVGVGAGGVARFV